MPPRGRIRIGVSSCLIGRKVRYDGGDKRDEFLAGILGPRVEWVPVCPELDVGMGVPREPVNLVGSRAAPRMVGVESGKDWTETMRRYSAGRARSLGRLNLSGYIFKSRSPSCGIDDVTLHRGQPSSGSRVLLIGGLFAREFIRAHPMIPAEDEARLADPEIRERFLVRVYAYRRLSDFLSELPSGNRPAATRSFVTRFRKFHASERFLLYSRSPAKCRALDAVVSETRPNPGRYARAFMECLAGGTSPGKHAATLRRMLELVPGQADERRRREILAAIRTYRNRDTGRDAPMGKGRDPAEMLREFVRGRAVGGVSDATYFAPYPVMLRPARTRARVRGRTRRQSQVTR